MPVKIRLQRHGKKGKPFYWIVAADARAKRDGRYLEKIGTYNPNTNPATVDLNIDSAVRWLEKGAQPTDTARTLLSYRGALLKHHLQGGVRKGALSQEDADKKLEAWLQQKDALIQAKIDGLSSDKAKAKAEKLAAEKAVNEKRAADAKALVEEAAAAATEEEVVTEEEVTSTEEVPATEEAPAAEEETPATEEEAPATEGEAPAAEEEAPAAEEETPAAEEETSATEEEAPAAEKADDAPEA